MVLEEKVLGGHSRCLRKKVASLVWGFGILSPKAVLAFLPEAQGLYLTVNRFLVLNHVLGL